MPKTTISGDANVSVMPEHYSDSWDHYLRRVTASKMDESQKEHLTKAVHTLRRNLGEDWPAESKDTTHSLLWSLRVISGSLNDGRLVIWGDCMASVENVKGFEGILAKIRRYDCFNSSIAELEMAGRLVKKGCNVEFEPKVGCKKPDLLCLSGDSKFLIEVKTLATADETFKARRTSAGVMDACRPVFPYGHIFKPLSEPHLKEIVTILTRESNRATSNMIDVKVKIDKVLNVYLVPNGLPGRIEMYNEWQSNQEKMGLIPRGISGLSGPSDNVRQEHRARIRIRQIARERQIPPAETGVIVITGPFRFWGIADVERFVDYMIEEVYALKNIPAVVLVSEKTFGDVEAQMIEREDFTFITNQVYEDIWEYVVIVKNRFCKLAFDHEKLKSIMLR